MSFDEHGVRIRYTHALREAYCSVDHNKPQRIAHQLISGGHASKYGVESAYSITVRETKRVANAVIVRPSAKLVKHQKANSAYNSRQVSHLQAIDVASEKADALHKVRRSVSDLEQAIKAAPSASVRRSLKQKLFELRTGRTVETSTKHAKPMPVQVYRAVSE